LTAVCPGLSGSFEISKRTEFFPLGRLGASDDFFAFCRRKAGERRAKKRRFSSVNERKTAFAVKIGDACGEASRNW
jgi:hypothetical protein